MMFQPLARALPSRKETMRAIVLSIMLVLILVVSVAPSFAQSLTLDIDVQPLFDGIQNFFPVAMAIFGVIGGLLIAFSLARFLVNAFRNAFEGNSI